MLLRKYIAFIRMGRHYTSNNKRFGRHLIHVARPAACTRLNRKHEITSVCTFIVLCCVRSDRGLLGLGFHHSHHPVNSLNYRRIQ